MNLEDIKWISIERDELRQCLYETRSGHVIFQITKSGTEMLPEYEQVKDILLEICLNWDTRMSYDYNNIISLKRDKKLRSINI